MGALAGASRMPAGPGSPSSPRRIAALARPFVPLFAFFAAFAAGAAVPTLSAGGSHSLAISTDGTLRVWGSDWSGQLGRGSQIDHPSPVPALGVAGIKAVSLGTYHTLALRND